MGRCCICVEICRELATYQFIAKFAVHGGHAIGVDVRWRDAIRRVLHGAPRNGLSQVEWGGSRKYESMEFNYCALEMVKGERRWLSEIFSPE